MTPERIKALRQSLGLTQSQFAEALGIKLRAVTYWEAGAPDRKPAGPALILLHMLERNPKLLRDVEKISSEIAHEQDSTHSKPRSRRG